MITFVSALAKRVENALEKSEGVSQYATLALLVILAYKAGMHRGLLKARKSAVK